MPIVTNVAVSGVGVTQSVATQNWQTGTWANKPSSPAVGDAYLVTDIGAAPGIQMIWNGTNWRPTGPVVLLNQTTSVTKTDANSSLQNGVSLTLPGGLIQPGMALRSEYVVSCNAGIAGVKNIRWQWGGVNVNVQSFTLEQEFRGVLNAMCMSSTSVQGWWNGVSGVFGATTTSNTVQTVNMANPQTLTCDFGFSVLGTGLNTLTLRGLKVWLDP